MPKFRPIEVNDFSHQIKRYDDDSVDRWVSRIESYANSPKPRGMDFNPVSQARDEAGNPVHNFSNLFGNSMTLSNIFGKK